LVRELTGIEHKSVLACFRGERRPSVRVLLRILSAVEQRAAALTAVAAELRAEIEARGREPAPNGRFTKQQRWDVRDAMARRTGANLAKRPGR